MSVKDSLPAEFRQRNHNGRYRRFQALGEALEVFFLLPVKGWYDIFEIVDMMELPHTPANVKRIRRICYALVRIGYIERDIKHPITTGTKTYWRRVK